MIRPPQRQIACAVLLLATFAGGCDTNEPIGRRGISDGRFQKPRAMAVDDNDLLYIVDMTARIQVLDTEGRFIRKWQTPDHTAGKPSGISISNDGSVLVADTHYYQLLIYSPEGKLLRTIGGTRGQKPGEFGLVTDAVQDSKGNYYVSEYGEYDRIQKFSAEGDFILQWGGHGEQPGQFARPQNMAIDEHDNIWVADACNHRIQVFDNEGKLLSVWGTKGSAPGELYYPYDLILTPEGNVYICEYGNHRVQKFTKDGQSLGCWGSEGRGPGELFNPWALAQTSEGTIIVLDSNNHRMQKVDL